MSKNIIVTLIANNNVNKEFDKLFNINKYYMEVYAKNCKSDFDIIYTDETNFGNICYSKLECKKYFDFGYERLLYLDADIFIKKESPNLFDVVPKDCLGDVQ